jgi:hypothetical protein
MDELRFRQIHLDFHTSEAIEGIGDDFDPEVFAETLAQAHVDSINLFARGHHGWAYFENDAFADVCHPHLTRDLLREQVEACHARDIRTPYYITVQWNEDVARRHPEWRVVTPEGKLQGPGPYEDGFYHLLCLNSPYVEHLKEFVQVVIDTLPIDGFWFDIVDARDCSCRYCKQGMLEEGLEPSDASDRRVYAERVLQTFLDEMTAFVHEREPEALVFYNSGHVGPRHRKVIEDFTHLELESLPSGGWGYLHFPIAARYARTLGKDFLGMTGKFHTSWGDFHSFKNRAALEFECFQMLALNAKCCVGDQLLPKGTLDPHTYTLIGEVYEAVEAKEPWCVGADAVTEIGVLTPEAFQSALSRREVDFRPMMGVTRMLQEGLADGGPRYQFDVIDDQADFSRYRVLVLPDAIPVDAALAAKLEAYLDAGGSLIASFASGMDRARTAFTLDALGVRLTGPGPVDAEGQLARGREFPSNNYAEYLMPRGALGAGLPETEHVMYMRGMAVEADAGGEVLADVVASYFDRTYKHYCSHRQTPSSGEVAHPAVVQRGQVIYFSHPIFTQYQTRAPRWCKQLVLNTLARLLPDPLVTVEAPTSAIATLNRQTDPSRTVLHLLHYVPERRGEAFDVIEDVLPIYEIPVSIGVDGEVAGVTCVPDGEALDFTMEDGRVRFVVPKVEGHQMVALSY